MKKSSFFALLAMSVFVLFMVSCSSDDEDPISTEEGLVLEGTWQLDRMDFLNKDDVKWNTEEIPFSRAAAFGYAPFMFDFGEISGFNFGHADVVVADEVVGSRFDYIMGGDFEAPEFNPNTQYWYWNYTNNRKSFEVVQLDGPLPPHDYTLYNVRKIDVSEDGRTITFEADLTSRKVGAERGDNLKTPVAFKINKGNPTKFVDVFIDGEPYVDPANPDIEG